MSLQELLELMQSGDMTKCKTMLETHCLVKNIADALKQYDPSQHKITDMTLRPDIPIYAENGTDIEGYAKLAHLPLSLQKKIVLTAAAFLGSPEPEATPNGDAEEAMMEGLTKTWEDNKLDYKFKNIAKKTMSQYHCAELWYTQDADTDYWKGTAVTGKFKLGMRILSYCQGDTLYPVFDEFGDMIAFGRAYEIKSADGKKIEHFDVYTAEFIYQSKNIGGDWLFADKTKVYSSGFKGVPNVIRKIPVIYYYQPLTEWADVQCLIERLEEIGSNHADTNDYVGSPIVFAEGETLSFPKKGQPGKFIQGNNGAKVSYLTYDAQPGSVKMEIENLLSYIYSLTHTVDTSFSNLKGLGYFSTVALQTIFIDAHIKAADKEEMFGECVQRRINYIKKALSAIDSKLAAAFPMKIHPKFTYLLPKNIQEIVDVLIKANDAGMISNETMVKMSPLVSDAEAELEALQEEASQQSAPVPVPVPTPTPTPVPAPAPTSNN